MESIKLPLNLEVAQILFPDAIETDANFYLKSIK
jgi:hypothetical protein